MPEDNYLLKEIDEFDKRQKSLSGLSGMELIQRLASDMYAGSSNDLGLGPAGMEASAATPLMTHAGDNLAPFARKLYNKLLQVKQIREAEGRKLQKLDVAKEYLQLRYPTLAKREGIDKAKYVHENDPPLRMSNNVSAAVLHGHTFKPNIYPPEILANAQGPFRTLPQRIQDIAHEGQHVNQRIRSYKGLRKNMVPEDLISENSIDQLTGRQGRYKSHAHGKYTFDEYQNQPTEVEARQAGTTAQTGFEDFIRRLRESEDRVAPWTPKELLKLLGLD